MSDASSKAKAPASKSDKQDASITDLKSEKDPNDERRERVRRCGEELDAVLRKHRCTVHAYLLPPEPVGASGDKVQLAATWGLHPYE